MPRQLKKIGRTLPWLCVFGLFAGFALFYAHVRALALPKIAPSESGRAYGAFHLHSDASHDSQVPVQNFAAAARSLGLTFIILTDHNNQRPSSPDGPPWILSYAEISSNYGHVIQLGNDRLLEPPLRKSPDVLNLIRNDGGLPIIAHPFDRKRPWAGAFNQAAGLEITNTASSIRHKGGPAWVGLAPVIAAWFFRPDMALAQLYDRDVEALKAWDENPDPHFLGMCGVDAHGWIAPADNLRHWYLVLDEPLTTEPAQAAPAIVTALRQGHFFCASGLLGSVPSLRFTAIASSGATHTTGSTTLTDAVKELRVVSFGVEDANARLLLFRDGVQVASSRQNELRYPGPGSGTYRVELSIELPTLLWGRYDATVAYSNRIRLRDSLECGDAATCTGVP